MSTYELIAEYNDFIIINKQSGIEFHGEGNLVQLIRKDYPSAIGVHRLDRETSGLMIFALNKESAKYFSNLFENRNIFKLYMGLISQKPKKKMGEIKGDLVKQRGGSYKLTQEQNNISRTSFISGKVVIDKYRLIVFRPFTGKTHQLRVVAKSLGSPLVGDKRYGKEDSDRMYLHACFLEFNYKDENFNFFNYPSTGEIFIQAEIKNEFNEIIESEKFKSVLKIKNEFKEVGPV